MKKLFTPLILVILLCCKNEPAKKTYRIYINTLDKSILKDRYLKRVEFDSCTVTSDSAAYQDAVSKFTAMKIAESTMSKRKIPPMVIALDFKVFDENRKNIKKRLNPEFLKQMNQYIIDKSK